MSDEKPYPEEIAEATRHPNGWVYRIAGNFSADEKVPPEAIVGAWKVNGLGHIEGEFVPNKNFDAATYGGDEPTKTLN